MARDAGRGIHAGDMAAEAPDDADLVRKEYLCRTAARRPCSQRTVTFAVYVHTGLVSLPTKLL